MAVLEKEMEEVQDSIQTHRVEEKRRERVRREEARAAREAQDMEMDEGGGGVVEEGE